MKTMYTLLQTFMSETHARIHKLFLLSPLLLYLSFEFSNSQDFYTVAHTQRFFLHPKHILGGYVAFKQPIQKRLAHYIAYMILHVFNEV